VDVSALTDAEIGAAVNKLRHPQANEATVAILIYYGDEFHQHGSGILIRLHDRSFLITASHVAERGSGYSLYLRGQSDRPAPLGGRLLLTTVRPGDEFDYHDIAVWELSEETLSALEGSVFLRQDAFETGEELADDFYFLTGFPASLASKSGKGDEHRIILTPFTYIAMQFRGDRSNLLGYLNGLHLLLGKTNPLELSGEIGGWPESLGGISGCAVWRAHTAEGVWSEGSARLAAIQTGVYFGGAIIKATPLSSAMSVIFDCYPELRRVLGISLPRRPR